MLSQENAQELLDHAVEAVASVEEWRSVLDALPAPIYIVDTEGAVTYWNQACVAIAGREPELGRDRWCVTWKIYTTAGDVMPHEECPMAQAVRTRRSVRDSIAIALRPDGSRIAFRPYPTPLFDENGELTGAINMLIDVTEEQAQVLHEQAERCRRLALALYDRTTSATLSAMASGFDETASQLDRSRNA